MNLPAYPKYKPSGVDWLGDVPEHWDSARLKQRFRIVNGGTPASSEESFWEGDVRWFTPEDLGRNPHDFIADSRRLISKEGLANCSARLSKAGSILLSTRAPIGHVALMRNEGCCNQGCRILEPNVDKTHGAFAVYAIISSREILKAAGTGSTFLELSAGDLGDHWMPSPPFDEQRAIAHFLDERTGKLDALAEKKRALIEKLKEKRSALISRTVTKGLPADAAAKAGLPIHPGLKNPNIEPLGEIPESWKAVRLKHLLKLRRGAVKTGPFGSQLQSAEMVSGEIKVYNQRSVLDRNFAGGDNYISLEKFEELKAFEAFPNDLLVTTRGTIGKCAVLPNGSERGILHPCVMRVQFDGRRIQNRFAEILIQDSGRVLEQLRIKSNATTIEVIYSESLREVWFALPPLAEQTAIIEYLDRETAKIDRMIEKVEAALEKLAEYRTALITAAVTGKIDVRTSI